MNTTLARFVNANRNVLSHKQAFELCSWWKDQDEALLNAELADAANQASTALGFAVSAANIRAARRITGKGKTYPRSAFRRAHSEAPSDVMRMLASELVRTQRMLNGLLAEFNMVQYERNPDLDAIARGRRIQARAGNGEGTT
jgi:hypothetical protein